MPAEWKPHKATWLASPHNASRKLAAIHWVYVEMVRLLHRIERVRIPIYDAR